MSKKRFKFPQQDDIKNHRALRWIRHHLEDPNLWHCTRKSISHGVLVGIFMSFMPMPFQMVVAVILGLFLRANLILAAVLCWISNPITMPPMLYACYKLGQWVLGLQANNFPESFSITHIFDSIAAIWQPLVLGCVVAGAFFAIIGYLLSLILWPLIAKRLENRNDQSPR